MGLRHWFRPHHIEWAANQSIRAAARNLDINPRGVVIGVFDATVFVGLAPNGIVVCRFHPHQPGKNQVF